MTDARAAAETDACEMARLRDTHDSAVQQYFHHEVPKYPALSFRLWMST